MHVASRLRKLRTDLWIVSSGKSFQIASTSVFTLARFCGFGFSLLKLTRIIYYYSVLHVNNILCHNNIPTKVAITTQVSLTNQLLLNCEIHS